MVCEALALNLATKSHFKGDFSHLNECFDKFLTFVTETPFCGCSNINVHTLTGSPVGVFFLSWVAIVPGFRVFLHYV